MRNMIKDIRLKNLLFVFILCFLVLPFLTTNTNAPFFLPGPGLDPGGGDGGGDPGDPGTITITSPTADSEFYYLDKINVRYTITPNPGFGLQKSFVLVNGVTRGTFYGTEVNANIYPNAFVGECSISIKANFFYNSVPKTKTSDSVHIYLYSAIDKDDIEDLRIDKLHKMGLGGQGMTICIIDSNLGFNHEYTGTNSLQYFHPSIYKERSNEYREIIFHDMDWDDTEIVNCFGQDHSYKEQKWLEIAEENSGSNEEYTSISRLHGACAMSTLVQVAPHARYVFIECELTIIDEYNIAEYRWNLTKALEWLTDNNRFRDFGIDILSFSGGGPPDDVAKNYLDILTNDPICPVIPVASSGNFDKDYLDYPASHINVIGVGGVQDRKAYKYYDPFNDFILCKDDFSDDIWHYVNNIIQVGLKPSFKVNTDASFSRPGSLGTNSVKSVNEFINIDYNGVQFWDAMTNGNIEAWFYAQGTSEHIGALWLRTSYPTKWRNPTFANGYFVQVENNIFSLQKCVNYNIVLLDQITLNANWDDQWWKMKFEAKGSELSAWLVNEDNTITKYLYYNDSNYIINGKPGFSANTNLGSEFSLYIDDLTIEPYDKSMNWQRYIGWVPDVYGCGSSYGTGLDIYAIWSGTELGWDPYLPCDISESFTFSGTSNACPLVAGIIAITYQYWLIDHTTKLTVEDFNRNEESIFPNTGDPIGYAPRYNYENPNGFEGAYFYKDFEFGFGVIDAYEIYIFMRDFM